MKKFTTLIVFLTICLGTNSVNAQNQNRKARKQAKQEEQARLLQQRIGQISMAIDSSSFVLEADRLQTKWGNTINVPSNLNFIAIHGTSGFIQIGSNTHIGSNGVGGISINSRISKMEIKKIEKSASYTIDLVCLSSEGTFYISITSNNDGQIASATITGNWGGRLTYLGKLVPTAESTVFKGTPRY